MNLKNGYTARIHKLPAQTAFDADRWELVVYDKKKRVVGTVDPYPAGRPLRTQIRKKQEQDAIDRIIKELEDK